MEKLKQLMISTYRKIGDNKGFVMKGKSYTGNQIAEEIENETELGVKIISNLLKLTIDLLKRDKLNINE
jgi:hypothetical protein